MVNIATGYQSQKTSFQYGVESTYGSAGTINTKIGTVKSFTPRNAWEIAEIRGVGDGREVQRFVRTRYSTGFTIAAELHEFTFLRHAVGPLAGSGTVGSPYTITEADHTGVTSSTQIIPFTLEAGSDGSTDDVDTYLGCFINDFSLQFDLGAPAMGTFNCIARNVTSGTSLTSYTPLSTTPMMMTSGSLSWGTSPTSFSGIRSASISYNNNMIIYGDWGTPLISQPETGRRSINWSVTIVNTNTVVEAWRDDFYGQEDTPVTDPTDMPYAVNNELLIFLDEGTTSGDRRQYIGLDHCIPESISKPIDIGNEDLVLVTISGRAATSGGGTIGSNILAKWWTV